MTLELWGGDDPSLVLVQDGKRIEVELANVKALVTTLVHCAADLVTAGLLFLIDWCCLAKKEP